MSSANVLFVDDDQAATQALVQALRRRGLHFEFHQASNSAQAISLLKATHPEVAIVDLSLDPNIGPESGFSLINQLLDLEPNVRVLVLTGHGAEEFGIQALEQGAASFLVKPVDPSHLESLIRDGVAYAQLKRSYQELVTREQTQLKLLGLASANPKMNHALETASFASTNNQPVLILGETGTGKGVLAQAIHRADLSRKGPFIRFQPGFGSQDLISSELFGHKRGAFTGATEDKAGLVEEADHGTLFIDEVDELPLETQILLLNVLQEKVFRRLGETKERRSQFRLIAATNRPLLEIRQQKKLREDFYHRIAHITVELPALRERAEDIESLALDFLRALQNRENILVQGFTPQTLARLRSYNWPGNIRELQAKVEGAAFRAKYYKRRFIEITDLEIQSRNKAPSDSGLTFRDKVHSYELELVQEALLKHDHNQTKAAESLQLDRTSFRRILERSLLRKE